jgi:hypothetical protein
MSNLDFLLNNSNFDKINNNKMTKKRRRKTVEATSDMPESVLIDVNKIRLSKSDDTFDLKLNSNELSSLNINSNQKLVLNDQIVPVPSSDLEKEFEKFHNFNELKVYQKIDVCNRLKFHI